MCQGSGYLYQLPSRTTRGSIHTTAPTPTPNKGVEQHLSQGQDLNGGGGPQSGTMCFFMFYVSAVDSVHSYRQRNEWQGKCYWTTEEAAIQKEPETCYVLPLGSWTFLHSKKHAEFYGKRDPKPSQIVAQSSRESHQESSAPLYLYNAFNLSRTFLHIWAKWFLYNFLSLF